MGAGPTSPFPPRRTLHPNSRPGTPDPLYLLASPRPISRPSPRRRRPSLPSPPPSFLNLCPHSPHSPLVSHASPPAPSPSLLTAISFPNNPRLSDYERTAVPRRPRPQNRIVNNPLRPHVAATDRLFCWTTPYAIEHNQTVFASLPPELAERAHAALRGAHAPNTKSSYASALLRFTQFCDKWKIPEPDRMPASHALLCAFIGEHKGSVAGGTIKLWMSGLKAWHDLSDAPWHGDHRWIQLARVTAYKEGTMHKRPLRAPVSIEHLLVLREALNLAVPHHAAIWAVATISFFGCRRLGETTITTISGFDPKYHVLRAATVSFRTLRDGTTSASFRIPWTKSSRDLGASVILTGRSDTLCPCAALQNHLKVNSAIPKAASLFAYLLPDGTWRHTQKHSFMEFCMDVWSRASLAHVLGHSFRIGGAVELLLAGVPPEVVAATGGWTSLAFLLYWRRMEEILPMSTSRAYKKSHINDLAEIFEQFRINNNIPRSLVDTSDGDLEV